MEIKIHRGLEQIGGCITEIRTATSRVFVDMGQNLPGCGTSTTREEDRALVEGVFAQNKKEYEAVFYTHGHEDHVGLCEYVPDNVPQYCSEGTKLLLLLKFKHILKTQYVNNLSFQSMLTSARIGKMMTFNIWKRSNNPQPIVVGNIKVTPFYNCHSIYDSHMFLIEADGKRIWHTGDYRAHGYIGDKLFPVLQKYATGIDTLITEGTMLSRDGECPHESIVSERMAAVMRQKKYVFILASSTDIERLTAIKQATLASGKNLYVCSGLMDDMMKFFTVREGRSLKSRYNLTHQMFDENNIDDYKNDGFVLVAGTGSIEKVRQYLSHFNQSETILVYSSWDGYYTLEEQIAANPVYRQFREMFTNVVDIHTSGHADRKTIEQVIKTINAKEVIIIHKEKDAKL